MKKFIILLCLVFVALTTNAQSSAGLVAHWDMNGTVNDVTGNGHDGHANYILSDTGMNGLPNTAYYFNGINSVITTPYLPDLNVSQYSICAIVKVDGFYTGNCQANNILTRGQEGTAGNYSLYFSDHAYDGNCLTLDTTKDVFCNMAGGFTAPATAWQYLPCIAKNKWYRVVATWDGIKAKVYVNDTLKSTVLNTGGAIGTSADSLAIGLNIFEPVYPYNFKGLIDDIRLYNRVLADTEIVKYVGDTIHCGTITTQPISFSTIVGHNAIFTVSTTITTPVYQWQQDAGSGFINLTNSGPYTGVTTNTLTIAGITTSMNNYHYRCIVSNSTGCSEISLEGILTTRTSVNNIITNSMIVVYPNPANNFVDVQLPYSNGIGNIQLINNLGQIISEQTINGINNNVPLQELSSGIYFLKIKIDGQYFYKKILKE